MGLFVVGTDFWLVKRQSPSWTRAVLGGTSLIFYFWISSFDRKSLGLRVLPLQPVSFWIRATVIIAILLLVPILLFLVAANWMQLELPIPRIPPQYAAPAFLHMCLIAPLLEEPIYRLAICFSTTVAFGPLFAILLSGFAFAGLHFIYGNPGPDNFLAGYVLAWSYLKSGSLMVPVVMHSLGNGVAFAFQLCAWYVF